MDDTSGIIPYPNNMFTLGETNKAGKMIIVFGSLHMDISLTVQSLPTPGETVLSTDYATTPGGKGGNQALAACRAGAKVAMIGCVGRDEFGRQLSDNLRKQGVLMSGLAKSSNPTGCAVVAHDAQGENQIIVASSASSDISADQVPEEVMRESNIILMQMEVPWAENEKVLVQARKHGARTILNLAPAIRLSSKMLDMLDILIVNLIEAKQLGEQLNVKISNDAMIMAQALSRTGDMTCIITLGPEGSVAATPDHTGWRVKAFPLSEDEIIDNTGAGDAYCGTLAAALHADQPLEVAMTQASVAGSLACKTRGAQASFPYWDDIQNGVKEMEDPKKIELS